MSTPQIIELFQRQSSHSGFIEEENDSTITVDMEISEFDEEFFTEFLKVVSLNPDSIIAFSVETVYPGDRPPVPVLQRRGSGLKIPSPSNPPDWYSDYRKSASYYVEEDEIGELAKELIDLDDGFASEAAVLNLLVDKGAVEEEMVEGHFEEFGEGNIELHLWSELASLRGWIRDEPVDVVTETLFPQSSLPVFVFLEEVESDDELILVSAPDLDSISVEELRSRLKQYTEQMEEARELFEHSRLPVSVSPRLFSTSSAIRIFKPILIYSAVGGIAESAELEDGEILRSTISSNKQEFSDSIELKQPNLSNDQITALSAFYSDFAQRGGSEVYRKIWYKAIVEHCNSIRDIPENSSEIIHYYKSLEQSAIEGNFTELSGAVQDAQIFIGDVTNSLSSSTVNLTSEVQKVVFAIFGIIGVNAFLLARNTNLDLALPFTATLASGLLLIYLPTAQERVNELDALIQEGKKDADVYHTLVENVGADKLVDLSKFEDRQNAYINLARKRVKWANARLKQSSRLISAFWLVSGVVAAVVFPIASSPNIVILLTLPIGFWISSRHADYEYLESRDFAGYQIHIPLGVALTILAVQVIVQFA